MKSEKENNIEDQDGEGNEENVRQAVSRMDAIKAGLEKMELESDEGQEESEEKAMSVEEVVSKLSAQTANFLVGMLGPHILGVVRKATGGSEEAEGPLVSYPACPGCGADLSESLSSLTKGCGKGHDISEQGAFGLVEIFFCSRCNHTLTIRRLIDAIN